MLTLKKRSEFVKMNKSSKSIAVSGFILQYYPAENIRVGFTASKKVGNAVVRNKCKRKLRALAREILLPKANPNYNYVFIARKSTATREFSMLKKDLIYTLNKIGNWNP